MANRALAAKVERAQRERRALANAEFGKAFYVEAAERAMARKAEMAQAVASFKGTIVKCPEGADTSDLHRRRAGCDPRTRGLYMPGRAVRAASCFARGCQR